MAELLLLGTGAAFNDGSREPTMLALRGPQSTIVVDCGSNAIRQLQRLDVPLDSIERLILTHEHADHTSGFGLLVEMLWLSGRREPLPIHGPAPTIDVARRLFAQWDTSGWKGMPELQWHEVKLEVGAPVATGSDFELTAAPGEHSVPVIGIRARDLNTGNVLVYGADGERSPGIQSLADGAGLLVLEATGDWKGHMTAAEAARLAKEARAQRLVLVHLAPGTNDLDAQHREAAAIFGEAVFIGKDLDRYDF